MRLGRSCVSNSDQATSVQLFPTVAPNDFSVPVSRRWYHRARVRSRIRRIRSRDSWLVFSVAGADQAGEGLFLLWEEGTYQTSLSPQEPRVLAPSHPPHKEHPTVALHGGRCLRHVFAQLLSVPRP